MASRQEEKNRRRQERWEAERARSEETRTQLLDELEARAVRAIVDTYGPYENFRAEELFWMQKGIEGMRLAIAERWSDDLD